MTHIAVNLIDEDFHEQQAQRPDLTQEGYLSEIGIARQHLYKWRRGAHISAEVALRIEQRTGGRLLADNLIRDTTCGEHTRPKSQGKCISNPRGG